MQDDPRATFEKDGRVWLRGVIPDCDLARLDRMAETGERPGERLAISDALSDILSEGRLILSAVSRIESKARPVRVVAFNKTAGTNWGLPWHQDRVITVDRRAEVDGYTNWTRKAGIWHCEPPTELLSRMLFVRIHLDDSDPGGGGMEIAVGSHSRGIVPAADAASVAEEYPIEGCTAQRGDVVVLKMLTLHRSAPSKRDTNRRVLRVDFAPFALPIPLRWA